jgi:hypothetical protein
MSQVERGEGTFWLECILCCFLMHLLQFTGESRNIGRQIARTIKMTQPILLNNVRSSCLNVGIYSKRRAHSLTRRAEDSRFFPSYLLFNKKFWKELNRLHSIHGIYLKYLNLI